MSSMIRYHFHESFISRTRLILRSIGLYLVVVRHLWLGSTLFFILAAMIPVLLALPSFHQGVIKNLEDYRSYLYFLEASLIPYYCSYLLLKIKYVCDHTARLSGFSFCFLWLKKLIPVLIVNVLLMSLFSIIQTLLITANPAMMIIMLSMMLLFLFPACLILTPLAILLERSLIKSICYTFKIIWGHFFYFSSLLVPIICIVYLLSYLLDPFLNALLPENLKIYGLIFQSVYIFIPYVMGALLLIIHQLLLKKSLPPLPRFNHHLSHMQFSFKKMFQKLNAYFEQ